MGTFFVCVCVVTFLLFLTFTLYRSSWSTGVAFSLSLRPPLDLPCLVSTLVVLSFFFFFLVAALFSEDQLIFCWAFSSFLVF